MIRYKKLGYVALNICDLKQSMPFYEKVVGLQFVGQQEDGSVFYRCSKDHHNVILYQNSEPGLKRVAFEMESPEQLEIAYEHFSKEGLNPKEVSKEELKQLNQGKTFRFTEPYSGITMEFYSEIMQLPHEYETNICKIARLGHVVATFPEFEKGLSFFKNTMNFRVSDTIGDGFAFMRCFPNPYHHSFAIGKGQERKLLHVAFMVTDIDDIGRGRNRLIQNNIPIVHGPGRHTPSGSIFLYFLDPDDLTIEYTLGMEEFPVENPRKPRYLEPSAETIDAWGSQPDHRKGAKGHIEVINES